MTWPPHSLVLTTPRLVLRGLCEADAERLAQVVPDDLETDPRLPRLDLPDERRVHVLQSYWREVGGWSPQDWVLAFSVWYERALVGLQALEGKDFAVRRTVATYSWLVPAARGLGLGKQMRSAVLSLAFGHLGAQYAVTEAWQDNLASLGVSRALGYADNGVDLHARDGRARRRQRLVLPAAQWSPAQLEVSGLEPCLPLLGLTRPAD